MNDDDDILSSKANEEEVLASIDISPEWTSKTVAAMLAHANVEDGCQAIADAHNVTLPKPCADLEKLARETREQIKRMTNAVEGNYCPSDEALDSIILAALQRAVAEKQEAIENLHKILGQKRTAIRELKLQAAGRKCRKCYPESGEL